MRVIVVDDDRIVCDSLAIILGAQEDIEVAGVGNDGDDAVRLYADLRPDIALLDIQMPGRDGLSAARAILAADPAARVVFLTTFSDDDYIVRALRCGARGYLIKQDVASIAPALRAVMGGRSVLEGEVLAKSPLAGDGRGTTAKGGASGPDAAPAAPASPAEPSTPGTHRPACFTCLTDREFEVARLIAEGLDNREIAAAAYMGEGTVRNHISSILAKMHLKNRTQIAVAYYRAGREDQAHGK